MSKHKEHFFKKLLDNASDLIWAIDMEGRFIYINDNIKEWGYQKEELIGKPLLNILNTTHISRRHSQPSEIGIKRTMEMEVVDKLGQVHEVIVSSSPLPDDDGNIIGIMGIIRDVTEIQNLEEKLRNEERLASLGRLAAGITHEVRNPLSSIKMNLTILMDRLNPTGDDKEHFLIARNEVGNLERVINELLDYAKPAPLKLNLSYPKKIIEDAVATVSASYKKEGVLIEKNIPEDLPMIFLDEGKAHQALLNILLNALQSSSPGDTVEIKGEVVRSPEKLFRIIVTDQGIGIKPEELKSVFDPFFTTKQTGTGLGLPIVRNIMKNHGGDVFLESSPGSGTRACLEFSAG